MYNNISEQHLEEYNSDINEEEAHRSIEWYKKS